jgi:hypothetical protein
MSAKPAELYPGEIGSVLVSSAQILGLDYAERYRDLPFIAALNRGVTNVFSQTSTQANNATRWYR